MKKLYLLLMSLFLLGGCISEPNIEQSQTQEPALFTIDEAKGFFEFIIQSNAHSDVEFPKNGLNPGEFTPQWNDALCSTEGEYYCVQVPIHSQYRFKAILSEYENCGAQAYSVNIKQRLVVLKDRTTDSLSSLIVTLIPDRKSISLSSKDIPGNLLCDTKNVMFQGIVIGHRLDSKRLASIEKYENGEKIRDKSIYVGKNYVTFGKRASEVNRIVCAMKVFRTMDAKVRSGGEDGDWTFDCPMCFGAGCLACGNSGDWDWPGNPGEVDPGDPTVEDPGGSMPIDGPLYIRHTPCGYLLGVLSPSEQHGTVGFYCSHCGVFVDVTF